jgi:hypothetical protein
MSSSTFVIFLLHLKNNGVCIGGSQLQMLKQPQKLFFDDLPAAAAPKPSNPWGELEHYLGIDPGHQERTSGKTWRVMRNVIGKLSQAFPGAHIAALPLYTESHCHWARAKSTIVLLEIMDVLLQASSSGQLEVGRAEGWECFYSILSDLSAASFNAGVSERMRPSREFIRYQYQAKYICYPYRFW